MASSTQTLDPMIVWLDIHIALPDFCRTLKKAFATTINPEHELPTTIDEKDIENLICEQTDSHETTFHEIPFIFKLFNDLDACYKYLLDNAGKKRIFLITSGTLGQYLVPKILERDQYIFQDRNGKLYEHSIYIFCADMAANAQWAEDFLDLDCIQMYNDERLILSHLTQHVAKYFISEGEQLLANEKIESIDDKIELAKKAEQYFTWAKTLYIKADSVWKGSLTEDLLHTLDKLIKSAQMRIKPLDKLRDGNGEEML